RTSGIQPCINTQFCRAKSAARCRSEAATAIHFTPAAASELASADAQRMGDSGKASSWIDCDCAAATAIKSETKSARRCDGPATANNLGECCKWCSNRCSDQRL